MYQVVKTFADKQDGFYVYHTGDGYPREGKEISAERISELSSNENALGEPLIVEVKEPKKRAAKKKE